MAEIIGKRVGKPSQSRASYSSKDLEKALKVMQSLGFKVTPPTTEAERIKQEGSLKKLGFSEAVRKVTEEEKNPKVLRGFLGATHVIAGQRYGPGAIELPIEQEGLFRGLLHQDQLAGMGHRDTTEYSTRSRYFMVGLNNNNSVKKVEVSEAVFSSDATWQNPGIVTGAMDIAGFHSDTQSSTRAF